MKINLFTTTNSNNWKNLGQAFDFIKGMGQNFGNGIKGLFSNIGKGIEKVWNDFTGITNNERNLEFQRENLDYQKAIQQEIFNREDTANQRTVQDMRLSGLNPLSMSGTNGAGEVVGTNSMESQKTSDLQAVSQILNVINQISTTRSNATLSSAQSNLINAQADNQRIKNIYENDILSKTLEGIDFSNTGKRFENERANIAWLNDINNFAFNSQFGLSDNMPELAKLINIGTHQGKLKEDWKDQFKRNWNNNSFGNTFNYYTDNPNFTNLQSMLEKSNLLGALEENKFGNALLKLLGIGL